MQTIVVCPGEHTELGQVISIMEASVAAKVKLPASRRCSSVEMRLKIKR
jgi:hypothetical protein